MQSNPSFTKSIRFKVANCISINFITAVCSCSTCLLKQIRSIRFLVHILAYFHNKIHFFHLCANEKGQIKLFSFGSTRLIKTSDGQGQVEPPSSWTSEISLVHFFFILLNLFFDGFFRFYLLVFVQLNCIHPGGKRQFAGFRDHHGGHIGIATDYGRPVRKSASLHG